MTENLKNNIFIIGDIHGCSRTFRHMIENVLNPLKTDQIYLLGDYIDRGPDSKGVIDFIFSLKNQNYNVFTLRGNHEELLLQSHRKLSKFQDWINLGATETLESFQSKSPTDIPDNYFDFFFNLPCYFELIEYKLIVLHAGLNMKIPTPFVDKDAMLWSRDTFVNREWLNGRTIVHGHTPTPFIEIQKAVLNLEPSISLDGGCVYKKKADLGNLIAMNFVTKELFAVKNIE